MKNAKEEYFMAEPPKIINFLEKILWKTIGISCLFIDKLEKRLTKRGNFINTCHQCGKRERCHLGLSSNYICQKCLKKILKQINKEKE